MPELKVSSMDEAAARACRRAAGTTGGIEVWVGYNGKAIVAGDPSSASSDRVKRSLPHIRVPVAPGDQPGAVAIRLAVAVAKLRKELPEAIARERPKSSRKPAKSHAWARKGASGRGPL